MTGQQQRGGDRFADYVPVAERIEQFYAKYPEGRIATHIIQHVEETGFVLMRAEAFRTSDDAQPASSGHAFEVRGESYVNKTSYIENCETGAVGRALALLGFEVKRGVASREEMQKAERMADNKPARPASVTKLPNLPANPKTNAETLEGHIMTALQILDKSEEYLNEWVKRQFKWEGDWSDMSTDLKQKTYTVLQGKIDAQNAGK